MTYVTLTPAQLRRMGIDPDTALPVTHLQAIQKARKPRHATTYSSPTPSVDSSRAGGCPVASYEEVVGLFGGTLHRWLWTKRVDGYISVCKRIQKHHKPEQGEGVRCEGCYQEEVTA